MLLCHVMQSNEAPCNALSQGRVGQIAGGDHCQQRVIIRLLDHVLKGATAPLQDSIPLPLKARLHACHRQAGGHVVSQDMFQGAEGKVCDDVIPVTQTGRKRLHGRLISHSCNRQLSQRPRKHGCRPGEQMNDDGNEMAAAWQYTSNQRMAAPPKGCCDCHRRMSD